MSFNLKRFSIRGLHGKFDIDIPIYDNRLILVGVNGLGKTTVVNILFFVLTDQWARLLDFEFLFVELQINEQPIRISKADVQNKLKIRERYEKVVSRYALRSSFPSKAIHRLVSHPSFQYLTRLGPISSRDPLVRALATEIEIPPSYVVRMLAEIPQTLQEDLFENRAEPASISELAAILKETGGHQVIYLPTYRRIEQDLKAIFPGLDEDDLRRLTSRSDGVGASKSRGDIELVHFGMQDVEKKIADELEAIQRRTRSQLSSLMASYLQDIIRSRADKFEPELIGLMDDETVKSVLSRVEENTLSNDDKKEVEAAIRRIRSGGSAPDVRDKYLTYFFSRLLEIYKGLADSEKNIRRLIETCNRYFERKTLIYDDVDFTSKILDADGGPLSWKVLSSGEKQVASLFTHLFLHGDTPQMVLIDEPELSLSVPWQKSLLPDISRSEKCDLLVAVTHSPFIFSNELDIYAVDLSKCISVSDVSAE